MSVNTDLIRCPQCGANNRVSLTSPPVGQPVCGRCKTPLTFADSPLTITDANFGSEVEKSPLPVQLDFWAAWCGDLTAGKSMARVFEDFNAFVAIVHKNLPKTRIIFISLKPSPSRWKLRKQFQQFNELIKEKINAGKGLQYVDMWDSMLDGNGEPRKDIFESDGLHMNARGYEIWRRVLDPYIRPGVRGKVQR